MVNPTENDTFRPPLSRSARRRASHAFVQPAPSARTRIGLPCRWLSGICANARSVTSMWSAVVFAPELPGRRIPAGASLVLSGNARTGWKPNPPLKCAAGDSFSV
jgi:hypothetical protein